MVSIGRVDVDAADEPVRSDRVVVETGPADRTGRLSVDVLADEYPTGRGGRPGGSNDRGRRSLTTASSLRLPPAARSWSSGSSGGGASSATNGHEKWRFTRSPNSLTSKRPETPGRRGRASWQDGDARLSWSASRATTPSTAGNQPQHSRRSHWRAGCSDNGHVRFGPGATGKGAAPCGNLASGLPVHPHNAELWTFAR